MLFALALTGCAATARAAIQILAVTSSTDFTPAAVAPGSLASVWCTGLAGISGVMSASGPVLPTQLAGITVYAGGSGNAPILAVADLGGYQLINIQVPWDASGYNAMGIMQGAERAIANAFNTAGWPVFFIDSNGYMIARHVSDYSFVTAANPARPGEWIVGYASNLGPVSNTPPSGVPAPRSPLSFLAPVPGTSSGSTPSFSVVVTRPGDSVVFQTDAVESDFIGLAPDTVGVYQVNFRIPLSPPMGDAIVTMRKNVDCGFFFTEGCGRGLTATLSNTVKLPLAP
jgi:uncharacterized protein (TIGR03437 family)